MPVIDVAVCAKDGGALKVLSACEFEVNTSLIDWLQVHAFLGNPAFIVGSSSAIVGPEKMFSVLRACAENGALDKLRRRGVYVLLRAQTWIPLKGGRC